MLRIAYALAIFLLGAFNYNVRTKGGGGSSKMQTYANSGEGVMSMRKFTRFFNLCLVPKLLAIITRFFVGFIKICFALFLLGFFYD